jgi:tetratricopeptide (TPR) repeat protein
MLDFLGKIEEQHVADSTSTTLTEAIAAARAGNRSEARELLARLLRADSSNVEYWIWMSAVVESPRERKYCLESALRLDPTNRAALRGLAIIGARKPDEAELASTTQIPHRKFKFGLEEIEEEAPEEEPQPTLEITQKPTPKPPADLPWKTIGMAAAGLLLIGAIILFLPQIKSTIESLFEKDYSGTAAELPPIGGTMTSTFMPGTSTATPVPAATRVMRTPIPTEFAGTPLAMLVENSPTSTPMIGVTPRSYEAYDAGISALLDGDYETALSYFDQILESEPKAADVHYFRGEALRLSGKPGSAIGAYDSAVNSNADYTPAYIGRARAFLARDQDENALVDYESALRREPLLTEIHIDLGKYYSSRKLWLKLESTMQESIELGVTTPRIYIFLSEAQLNLGNYKGALENALTGSAEDPSLLEGYLAVGRAYVSWGVNSFDTSYFAASLWPLQTYTTYQSEDHRGWAAYARAQAGLGNLEGALEAANKSLQINEKYAPAYIARAIVNLNYGNYQLALDDLLLASRYGQETYDLLFHLADAHIHLGHYEDAISAATAAQTTTDDEPIYVNEQIKIAEAYALMGKIYESNPEAIDDAIMRWRWILELEHVRPETLELAETHLAELRGEGPTRTPTPTPTLSSTTAEDITNGDASPTPTP